MAIETIAGAVEKERAGGALLYLEAVAVGSEEVHSAHSYLLRAERRLGKDVIDDADTERIL